MPARDLLPNVRESLYDIFWKLPVTLQAHARAMQTPLRTNRIMCATCGWNLLQEFAQAGGCVAEVASYWLMPMRECLKGVDNRALVCSMLVTMLEVRYLSVSYANANILPRGYVSLWWVRVLLMHVDAISRGYAAAAHIWVYPGGGTVQWRFAVR